MQTYKPDTTHVEIYAVAAPLCKSNWIPEIYDKIQKEVALLMNPVCRSPDFQNLLHSP